MRQTKFNFPTYVANQVLTFDELNKAFEYLDEQERLTRTNLFGIGVMCGLEVTVDVNPLGNAVLHVSAGLGVTSQGFLVSIGPQSYTQYQPYNFTLATEYDPFCTVTSSTSNGTTTKTVTNINGIQINQLIPYGSSSSATNDGGTGATAIVGDPNQLTPLTANFLADKVVILFYELNNVQGINCNPENCDGLGIDVNVTVRLLLIDKDDYDAQLPTLVSDPNTISGNIFYNMSDLAIKRFDVPSTNILTAGEFYHAYQRIYTAELFNGIQNAMSLVYSFLYPMLERDYPTDPFADFANNFSFLQDAATLASSSNFSKFVQIQYYSDLIMDLINGYNELKETGLNLTGDCSPSPDLFPRHLGLGLLEQNTISNTVTCNTVGSYYYAFMPSRIISGYYNVSNQILSLYNRMVLMYKNFNLPVITSTTGSTAIVSDDAIKITPTVIGRTPLSDRSIPFYYTVPGSNPPVQPSELRVNWNYKKKLENKSDKILSYYADTYNSTDTYVIDPLTTELEPYNFFRFEGYVGKNYANVISNLQNLISTYRIPIKFTVVLVGFDQTNDTNLLSTLQQFTQIPTGVFEDLELAYKTNVSEIIARFVKTVQTIYAFTNCLTASTIGGPPASVLLKDNAPDYKIPYNSMGGFYEQNLYKGLISKPYSSPVNTTGLNATISSAGNIDNTVQLWVTFFAVYVAYYCEEIYYLINSDLNTFSGNVTEFVKRYSDLQDYLDFLVNYANNADTVTNGILPASGADVSADLQLALQIEDMKIALSELRSLNKGATMEQIGREYTNRLNNFAQSLTFSNFVSKHPGIQHKAGVPEGGTLILVVYYKSNTSGAITSGSSSSSGSSNSSALAATSTFTEKFTASLPQIVANPVAELLKLAPDVLSTFQINKRFFENLQIVFTGLQRDDSGTMESGLSNLANGACVADFYLPYIISSDLPPTTFTVSNSQPPLFLDVAPGTYVIDTKNPANDSASGNITYGPAGGVLTVDGSPVDGPDFTPSDFNSDTGPRIPNFNPMHYMPATGALMRAVPIEYKMSDTNFITKYAYVYYMPQPMFTPVSNVTVNANNSNNTYNMIINFDFSASQYYNRLIWNFGDGTPLVQLVNPVNTTTSHTFVIPAAVYKAYSSSNLPKFTVVLTAFNDSYMNIYSLTFTINFSYNKEQYPTNQLVSINYATNVYTVRINDSLKNTYTFQAESDRSLTSNQITNQNNKG